MYSRAVYIYLHTKNNHINQSPGGHHFLKQFTPSTLNSHWHDWQWVWLSRASSLSSARIINQINGKENWFKLNLKWSSDLILCMLEKLVWVGIFRSHQIRTLLTPLPWRAWLIIDLVIDSVTFKSKLCSWNRTNESPAMHAFLPPLVPFYWNAYIVCSLLL